MGLSLPSFTVSEGNVGVLSATMAPPLPVVGVDERRGVIAGAAFRLELLRQRGRLLLHRLHLLCMGCNA